MKQWLAHTVFFMLLLMQGCGFQLRGTGAKYDVGDIDSVYIAESAAGRIAAQIKSRLVVAGIKVENSARDADYSLHLHNEAFAQNIQSVSAKTGKAREFQIVFSVLIRISKASGERPVEDERITVAKDYTFDEEALLGKSSEEDVIREELLKQAAAHIVRRLLAVIK